MKTMKKIPAPALGYESCYSIRYGDVLNATEICVDTSVLEKLFPWVFETTEGKELLEKKKADTKDRKQELKKDKEEFVLRMDRKTAEVLRCVVGLITGDKKGPRGAMDKIHADLCKQGLVHPCCNSKGTIDLPDTWKNFEKEDK